MIVPVKVGDPTFEAVSRADAKAHSYVGHTDDDGYFDGLVVAAREQLEKDTNLSIVLQEFDHFTESPLARTIKLPVQPAASITSVKYTDADDVEQTVDAGDYSLKLHRDPPEVELDEDFTIPTSTDTVIRFKAGYADAASVPRTLRQAILFLTDNWYNNRTPLSNPSTLAHNLPLTYLRIVAKSRVKRYR